MADLTMNGTELWEYFNLTMNGTEHCYEYEIMRMPPAGLDHKGEEGREGINRWGSNH